MPLASRRNGGYTTWICQVTHRHVGFETAGRTAVSSRVRHHRHIDCLFKHQFIALASMWCQDFTRIEHKPKVKYTTYLCEVTHPHVGFETDGRNAVSSWFRYCKHKDCPFSTSHHCTCKYVVSRFHSDWEEMWGTRPEHVKWHTATWGLKLPGERQFQVELVIIDT